LRNMNLCHGTWTLACLDILFVVPTLASICSFQATLMLLVIHWLMTPFMMTLGTESPTVCCDLFAEQELQHSKWGDFSFSRFARNTEHWHLDIIHLLEYYFVYCMDLG